MWQDVLWNNTIMENIGVKNKIIPLQRVNFDWLNLEYDNISYFRAGPSKFHSVYPGNLW